MPNQDTIRAALCFWSSAFNRQSRCMDSLLKVGGERSSGKPPLTIRNHAFLRPVDKVIMDPKSFVYS
ncbi:MAG: hypothetical protein JNK96_08840, partial [Betaproteobacteria bacterium]|nr:hypothetical protein [Betaproteobacteria bacterium]